MVHIGKLIKEEVHRKNWSVSKFAKEINTNRNNVYNIFTRQSIDTELLFTISIVLKHDFFQYYQPVVNSNTTPNLPAENIFTDDLKKWLQQQFKLLNKKIDTIK